jgi:PQQ-dependent catabolism-associated CXXCW motif protein
MTFDRRRLLLGAAAALVAANSHAEECRTQDDDAPTPAVLHGAQVLTTAQAEALWRVHAAVFIDVMPRPPRPSGLPAGTIWRPRPRLDIPGSMWLPDVGYCVLAPPMEAYFARNLQAASAGRRERMLVFYCRLRCWHSWYAARRALGLGYAPIGWYPGGTDEWQAAGLPLAPATPQPRPDMTQ